MKAATWQLGLFTLGMACAGAGEAAVKYQITDLHALGFMDANAINNAGQVVGAGFNSQAMLWDGKAVSNLGAKYDNYSAATAISRNGQITGWSFTGEVTTSRLTLWNSATPNAAGKVLDTTNNSDLTATGINNAGQIVYKGGSGAPRIFNTSNNTYTTLGTLGGTSRTLAINDSGQVAGWSFDSDGASSVMYGTVWNGTTATRLESLGGQYTMAKALNNAGQLAGEANGADDLDHAVIWNGTHISALNSTGLYDSSASAINNKGQVVGSGRTTGSYASHAMLWEGNTAFDLNSLLSSAAVNDGWILMSATGINDSGTIVGNASKNGALHSYMLTVSAVPEADTYAMLLAGLGLLGWTARRRKAV